MTATLRTFKAPVNYTYDPGDVIGTSAQVAERSKNRNDFIVDCRYEYPGLSELLYKLYAHPKCTENTKFWCLHGRLTPYSFKSISGATPSEAKSVPPRAQGYLQSDVRQSQGKICEDTHPPLSLESRLKYFSIVPLKFLHIITFGVLTSLPDFYENEFQQMRAVTIWTLPSLADSFKENTIGWRPNSNMSVKDISELPKYWDATEASLDQTPAEKPVETTPDQQTTAVATRGFFSWWSK